MLQEPRLCAPAFDVINIAMVYDWQSGWTLKVSGRRDGTVGWEKERYELMTSPEMADVACCVLTEMLGL